MAPIDLARQYATDGNLSARQRLWERQDPAFDVVGWTLDLAGVAPGDAVLDVGCGNGHYLAALRARGIEGAGCDLSAGMLASAAGHAVVAADAVALPFPSGCFDVVLAPHMLYHVPDRRSAARELRRVLAPGGRCVVVTNGAGHLASLRAAVEGAVAAASATTREAGATGTAGASGTTGATGDGDAVGWGWSDRLLGAFSLENGADQLRVAFDRVRCIRPDRPGRAVVTDAAVIAGYLGSVDHDDPPVPGGWARVVADVAAQAASVIEAEGEFVVPGDVGAFVCS